MEHIEQAGVHSGDSACSLPPYSLSPETIDELKRQTALMAKGLNVVGLMNVQFAIQQAGSDGKLQDVVFVLEVNPRASRTVPFVSKATGLQLAKIAARCMVGQIAGAARASRKEVMPPYFSVKEAVFPFVKFPGVDTILGPEMKSTGEVMGVGKTFGEAFVKSQLGAGVKLPKSGKVFLQRQRQRQAARRAGRARTWSTIGLLDCGDQGHGGRDRRRRHPGHHGQQGGRRPSAYRRHDQEPRDRAGDQYGRRKAQCNCRLAARSGLRHWRRG